MQKNPLLMHVQHKYVFHVSVTNSYFSFYIHFNVSPADSVIEETGATVCVCFCTKRSLEHSVQGPVSPGTPLNDSSDLLPSSVVGMRSSRSQRVLRGRLKQHGVNMWPPHRQTGSNCELTLSTHILNCDWQLNWFHGNHLKYNYSWLFCFWLLITIWQQVFIFHLISK